MAPKLTQTDNLEHGKGNLPADKHALVHESTDAGNFDPVQSFLDCANDIKNNVLKLATGDQSTNELKGHGQKTHPSEQVTTAKTNFDYQKIADAKKALDGKAGQNDKVSQTGTGINKNGFDALVFGQDFSFLKPIANAAQDLINSAFKKTEVGKVIAKATDSESKSLAINLEGPKASQNVAKAQSKEGRSDAYQIDISGSESSLKSGVEQIAQEWKDGKQPKNLTLNVHTNDDSTKNSIAAFAINAMAGAGAIPPEKAKDKSFVENVTKAISKSVNDSLVTLPIVVTGGAGIGMRTQDILAKSIGLTVNDAENVKQTSAPITLNQAKLPGTSIEEMARGVAIDAFCAGSGKVAESLIRAAKSTHGEEKDAPRPTEAMITINSVPEHDKCDIQEIKKIAANKPESTNEGESQAAREIIKEFIAKRQEGSEENLVNRLLDKSQKSLAAEPVDLKVRESQVDKIDNATLAERAKIIEYFKEPASPSKTIEDILDKSHSLGEFKFAAKDASADPSITDSYAHSVIMRTGKDGAKDIVADGSIGESSAHSVTMLTGKDGAADSPRKSQIDVADAITNIRKEQTGSASQASSPEFSLADPNVLAKKKSDDDEEWKKKQQPWRYTSDGTPVYQSPGQQQDDHRHDQPILVAQPQQAPKSIDPPAAASQTVQAPHALVQGALDSTSSGSTQSVARSFWGPSMSREAGEILSRSAASGEQITKSDGTRTAVESQYSAKAGVESQSGIKGASDSQTTTKAGAESQSGIKGATDSQITTKAGAESQSGIKGTADLQVTTKAGAESQSGIKGAADSQITTKAGAELAIGIKGVADSQSGAKGAPGEGTTSRSGQENTPFAGKADGFQDGAKQQVKAQDGSTTADASQGRAQANAQNTVPGAKGADTSTTNIQGAKASQEANNTPLTGKSSPAQQVAEAGAASAMQGLPPRLVKGGDAASESTIAVNGLANESQKLHTIEESSKEDELKGDERTAKFVITNLASLKGKKLEIIGLSTETIKNQESMTKVQVQSNQVQAQQSVITIAKSFSRRANKFTALSIVVAKARQAKTGGSKAGANSNCQGCCQCSGATVCSITVNHNHAGHANVASMLRTCA